MSVGLWTSKNIKKVMSLPRCGEQVLVPQMTTSTAYALSAPKIPFPSRYEAAVRKAYQLISGLGTCEGYKTFGVANVSVSLQPLLLRRFGLKRQEASEMGVCRKK
jgi:hypothetical protein